MCISKNFSKSFRSILYAIARKIVKKRLSNYWKRRHCVILTGLQPLIFMNISWNPSLQPITWTPRPFSQTPRGDWYHGPLFLFHGPITLVYFMHSSTNFMNPFTDFTDTTADLMGPSVDVKTISRTSLEIWWIPRPISHTSLPNVQTFLLIWWARWPN